MLILFQFRIKLNFCHRLKKFNENMSKEEMKEELGRGKRQRKQRHPLDFDDFGIVSNGKNGSGNPDEGKANGAEKGGDGGGAAGNGGKGNEAADRVDSRLSSSTPSSATINLYKKRSKFESLNRGEKPVLHVHRLFRDEQGREYNQTEVVGDPRLVQNYLKMRTFCSHKQLRQFAFDGDEAIKDFKQLRRNMLKRLAYHASKKDQQQEEEKKEEKGGIKRVRFVENGEKDEENLACNLMKGTKVVL